MKQISIIGDVHGQYDEMIVLLRDHAGLIDADLRWCGGANTLCFLGDYVDRGPNGLKVINHIMQWEQQAQAAGGQVLALLGNHDVMFLAAYQFRHKLMTSYGGSTFIEDWVSIGGQPNDMKHMTDAHAGWLRQRPAMVLLKDHLLMHADAMFYSQYGTSIEAVNKRFQRILHSDDVNMWNVLLDDFVERNVFYDCDMYGRVRPGGTKRARMMLNVYGGTKIIHGHTPIPAITGQNPADVLAPLVYADGLCVNVDGGMYRGSPGVVYQLEG